MSESHFANREFQILAKPVGSVCNLACKYCYYLETSELYTGNKLSRMPDHILELYIQQHIEASTEETILFSWHGGEPTMAGIPFFEKVLKIQERHNLKARRIVNGIQTNGTLINESWISFLSDFNFIVGLSIDGPSDYHDFNRRSAGGGSSFESAMQAYHLLRKKAVQTEVLCVVNEVNVKHALRTYHFFKSIDVTNLTFLPLVIYSRKDGILKPSVSANEFGSFLILVFDEWCTYDIGRLKVQIFEEALRTAFNQNHTLCIFKKECGAVPVIEHNGDFYACDFFVDKDHLIGNIQNQTLSQLLDSDRQKKFGQHKWDALPEYCLDCEVLEMCYGGCPKNRFIKSPDGSPGLNYLCEGYKQFFNHCKPFVNEVARIWKDQSE